METHFHIFPVKYQFFKKYFKGILFKITFTTTFPQYFLKEYCLFGGCQGASQGCHTQLRSLAMAKRAIFLQNILWENYSKFNFKQCSIAKFVRILIFQPEYIKMCFHSNQHPSSIKHPFISLYSKYRSLRFICLPIMNSPIFPSLDDIYCTPNAFQ